jgi:2,3-bisphosphoglycerate-independent phosphoglycerate mutase
MLCETTTSSRNWQSELAQSYDAGIFDEFINPTLLNNQYAIKDNDAVIFVNVRPDRALQLTNILLKTQIQQQHNAPIRTLAFVMTGYRYTNDLKNPVILEPILAQETILDVIISQAPERPIFLIAETEKYAHVTYFFKGMRDQQAKQETRMMVPSLKIHDYVKHPEMSAAKITEQIELLITKHPNAFCVVNYANADMVGHSGDLKATIAACLVLEAQLIRLYEAVVVKMQGTLLITADHGNAEEMFDVENNPKTAHTINPVPLVIASKQLQKNSPQPPKDLHQTHSIAHAAPTLLRHMGLRQPIIMAEPFVYEYAQQE